MNNYISELISKDSIQIYMQAVVSYNQKFDVGLEAFVKGVCPLTGVILSPFELFSKAKEEELEYQLNILIFKKAVSLFSVILKQLPKTLLYINMDDSIICNEAQYDDLLAISMEAGVKSDSIALDIGDSQGVSVNIINNFIDHQRRNGFYISIDDIGKNYFNLDRIVVFNPDIIKINHQYFEKLNNPSYTQMVIKHIFRIAHDMGMIVVETGLEKESEIVQAATHGAQYFQGYFIHHPSLFQGDTSVLLSDVDKCIKNLQNYTKSAEVNDNRQLLLKVVEFLNDIKEEWKKISTSILEEYMASLFAKYPAIENGWITNSKGIQISKACINSDSFSERNCRLFQIQDIGFDYSNEEFYQHLSTRILDTWITKPYISLLTNGTCVAASTFFDPKDNESNILCLVINYEAFVKSNFQEKVIKRNDFFKKN